MHRLNLHLSANSSLVISLLVFLSTSGYFSGGHLSDLSKSLLETFLLISYSSLTLVFHTEDNPQNCLLISVRHTPIPTKSPLGNNKNIQIILKQGIYSVVSTGSSCTLFALAAGSRVQVVLPMNTSSSWKFYLGFFNNLMNILKCLLLAVLFFHIISSMVSSQFVNYLAQNNRALCISENNSKGTQVCPVHLQVFLCVFYTAYGLNMFCGGF